MGYKRILQGASGKEFFDKEEMLEKKASTVPFVSFFMLVTPWRLIFGAVAILLRLGGNKDESQQVGNGRAEEKPWALAVKRSRWEDVTVRPSSWIRACGGSSPFPAFGMCILPTIPIARAFWRTQLWERNVWVDCDWTSWKLLYRLVRFGHSSGGGDLLVLQGCETSLKCRFPCLLKLPSPNLEWSASLPSLSWPSL